MVILDYRPADGALGHCIEARYGAVWMLLYQNGSPLRFTTQADRDKDLDMRRQRMLSNSVILR